MFRAPRQLHLLSSSNTRDGIWSNAISIHMDLPSFFCCWVCAPNKQMPGDPNKQHNHVWCYTLNNTTTTTKYYILLVDNIIWISLRIHTCLLCICNKILQLPRKPAVSLSVYFGHDTFCLTEILGCFTNLIFYGINVISIYNRSAFEYCKVTEVGSLQDLVKRYCPQKVAV